MKKGASVVGCSLSASSSSGAIAGDCNSASSFSGTSVVGCSLADLDATPGESYWFSAVFVDELVHLPGRRRREMAPERSRSSRSTRSKGENLCFLRYFFNETDPESRSLPFKRILN